MQARGVSCAPFVIPTNRSTPNFHDAFLPHSELDSPAASKPRTSRARARVSPLLWRSQGTAARHLLIFLPAEDRRPRSSEDTRTPSDSKPGAFCFCAFANGVFEKFQLVASASQASGRRRPQDGIPAVRRCRRDGMERCAPMPGTGGGRMRAGERNCRSKGGNAKHRSNGVQRYGLAVPSGARGAAECVCPMPGGGVSRRKR